MEIATIKCVKRSAKGSNQVARLREAGKVPGVIYGGEKGAVAVCFDDVDVAGELRKHHRVFEIDIEGEVEPVYMQEVQYDVVTDRPVHLDFLRIDMSKPISIDVELLFLGHPVGAAKGGVLVRDHAVLHIKSLPAAVPHEIEVQVADIDIGSKVLAGDIALPEGVTLELPPSTVICHMPAPSAEEPEPEPEVAAEGDEAPAAAPESDQPAP